MQKKWTLYVTVLAVMVSYSAFGEEALHSWVANALRKIPPKLEKAESLANQGDMANAKVFLGSAQTEWDQMHTSLRDKFKDDHPDIVAVRKQLEAVTAKVLGAAAAKKAAPKAEAPKVEASKKLHSWVANALGKIPPKLEKAESLANQGDMANANVSLGSAQREWDQMHTSFKGKFDENHPDIVAVRKQLEAVKAKMAGGAAAKVETPTSTVASDGPAITEPLPSTMVYEMKQYNKNLDWTIENAATMSINDARRYLEKEHNWHTKKEWSKGKFHPQHPDVLAMDAKVAEAKRLVQARVDKAEEAEGNLEGVLAVIKQNAEALDAVHKKAKWAIRSLGNSSSISKGDQYRAELEEARSAVERMNALLSPACAAVQDFRRQFPDMKEMEALVKNGLEARNAVQGVERYPELWLEEIGWEISTALDSMEGNLKTGGLEDLASKQGLEEILISNWAESAEENIVNRSSLLLEIIDVLLPELPETDQAVLPEFVQARQDALARGTAIRAEVAKVEVEARKIRKDMVDAKQQKLASARFPKSEYHGGKWDDAEKVIRKAFEAAIKDKQLLKIDIYRPWEELEKARWHNKAWEVNTYRYIGANCLTKLSSGKYMVYRMNFRNTKLTDGSWSTLEQWSVGHVYEMLEENINK